MQQETTNQVFFMTAKEYMKCIKAVKRIEKERNKKFTDDEFQRMITLLYDPELSLKLNG